VALLSRRAFDTTGLQSCVKPTSASVTKIGGAPGRTDRSRPPGIISSPDWVDLVDDLNTPTKPTKIQLRYPLAAATGSIGGLVAVEA
jgi:hypothetical protein